MFFWLHLKPYEGDYVINTDKEKFGLSNTKI